MRIHSSGRIISSDDEVVAVSLSAEERELLRNAASDVRVFVVGPPDASEETLARVAAAVKSGRNFAGQINVSADALDPLGTERLGQSLRPRSAHFIAGRPHVCRRGPLKDSREVRP